MENFKFGVTNEEVAKQMAENLVMDPEEPNGEPVRELDLLVAQRRKERSDDYYVAASLIEGDKIPPRVASAFTDLCSRLSEGGTRYFIRPAAYGVGLSIIRAYTDEELTNQIVSDRYWQLRNAAQEEWNAAHTPQLNASE